MTSIAELRAIEGSHLTLQALRSNSDNKVRPDKEALAAAERGFNSFIPFPTPSGIEMVRLFDSNQNRKVDSSNIKGEVKKICEERIGLARSSESLEEERRGMNEYIYIHTNCEITKYPSLCPVPLQVPQT